MKIEVLTGKIRCDMPNCKNMASIKVIKSGFLRSVGLNLCDECRQDLYNDLGRMIVPKSPENMLNKKIVKERVK